MTEAKAKIIEIKEQTPYLLIVLDKTVFHHRGGGQPADKGFIDSTPVLDVYVEGNKTYHKIGFDPSIKEKLDNEVELNIDKEFRKKITRMHTAEHIFFRALQNIIPDIELEKINLDKEESTICFKASNIGISQILDAEKTANEIIKQNKDVNILNISKEEAKKLAETGKYNNKKDNVKLRIKLERIKENMIRVIEVKDFDLSACTGTHLAQTGEIGSFLVTGFNQAGKSNYEIRFKVDVMEELYKYARCAREIHDCLKIDYNNILAGIKNMQNNVESMKNKIRELSKGITAEINKLDINGIILKTAIFPGINKKDFIEKANAEKEGNAVVCFINDEGERKSIAILTGDCLKEKKPANDILNELCLKFSCKGGGNQQLAQGMITCVSSEDIIKTLKEILK